MKKKIPHHCERAPSALLFSSCGGPAALDCNFKRCPPPAGVAPVQNPAGGFAIDGNLLANSPTDGTATGCLCWLRGAVLDSAGKPSLLHDLSFYRSYGGNDSIFSGGLKWYGDPNTWTYTSGKPRRSAKLIMFSSTSLPMRLVTFGP